MFSQWIHRSKHQSSFFPKETVLFCQYEILMLQLRRKQANIKVHSTIIRPNWWNCIERGKKKTHTKMRINLYNSKINNLLFLQFFKNCRLDKLLFFLTISVSRESCRWPLITQFKWWHKKKSFFFFLRIINVVGNYSRTKWKQFTQPGVKQRNSSTPK